MKKTSVAILFILILALPAVCFASFAIKLKNGNTIITSAYWHEGNQVMFYFADGVVGIDQNQVVGITKSQKRPFKGFQPAKKEKAKGKGEEGSLESDEKTAEPTKEDVVRATRGGTAPEIDIEAYKAEKKALMDEYNSAHEEMKKAQTINDKKGLKEAKKKRAEYQKKISQLALKLKKENYGILPPWWTD